MGKVYLGYDTLLLRAVAIKLIGSRNTRAASQEQALAEARAIARLSHPNVVTIYRVGTSHDGRPFLVQELIRGKSLDRIPRPMPWRELCPLAIGIARGLESAHRGGILHCDVKPANVMVDDSGVPRLIDFGLARLSAASESWEAFPPLEPPHAPAQADIAETADPPSERSTASPSIPHLRGPDARDAARGSDPCGEPPPGPAPAMRRILGTPRYLAPELWHGAPADVRSDLYSLGVMLYELLVGTVPHPQTDREALRRATLSGSIQPIHDLAPDTPRELATLVMRCLALDPRARPDSAASIANELAAVRCPAG